MHLSPLERASVLAVESLLRNSTTTDDGDYSDEDTRQFLFSNCPRFEGFSVLNGDGAVVGTGKGIDVQMFIVHKEYCENIEQRIIAYLHSIDLEPEQFQVACAHILAEPANTKASDTPNPAKRAATNLVRWVERYQDFSLFGHMMESEFMRLYGDPSSGEGVGEGESNGAAVASSSSNGNGIDTDGDPGRVELAAASPGHRHDRDRSGSDSYSLESSSALALLASPGSSSAIGDRSSVRVLWDIENIAVPRRLGGLATVDKISSFLKTHNLSGSGIDCRTTIFFNPAKLSDQVVRDLDSAGVELVWISPKQEDADRKLVRRISQEMAVLPPKSTSFVLITSDKDFRSQIQLLTGAGYEVIIIHSATHEDWSLSLEMHATQAFRWADVIGAIGASYEKDGGGEAPPAAADEDNFPALSSASGSGGGNNNKSTGPNPSKHRREIEKAALVGASPASFFNDFLDQFGVGGTPGAVTGTVGGGGGRGGMDDDGCCEVKLVTGGNVRLHVSRIFTNTGTYMPACVLKWKGAFGFLAVPIRKTAEELAVMSSARPIEEAEVGAGGAMSDAHAKGDGGSGNTNTKTNGSDRAAGGRDGASAVDTINAVRYHLGINAAQSAHVHLAKVFAHHHVLHLDPKKSHMERYELCQVRVGPNAKGPSALDVLNAPQLSDAKNAANANNTETGIEGAVRGLEVVAGAKTVAAATASAEGKK